MASVDDVAAAVLKRTGAIDTFKLQELVYYCQAWHLVWEDERLFTAKIEAWANGPVVRKLYAQHRRQYRVTDWPSGDASKLREHEATTVDAVAAFYGEKSGRELAELTHRQDPWRLARQDAGLAPSQRGTVEITLDAMLEYYGGLIAADVQ